MSYIEGYIVLAMGYGLLTYIHWHSSRSGEKLYIVWYTIPFELGFLIG